MNVDMVCQWIAEIVTFLAALVSFAYGVLKFFKKGRPLYLQSITMAMGCISLGRLYQICLMLVIPEPLEGFTPVYLGSCGFYLFLLTASYGQMDRIIDDGSKSFRKSRIIALLAPSVAIIMFIPVLLTEGFPTSTKIMYTMVWIPALFTLYFNFKHAIIPNMDFGFVKATRPYNYFALFAGLAELLCMISWVKMNNIFMISSALLFSVCSILTILFAKRGADRWTL